MSPWWMKPVQDEPRASQGKRIVLSSLLTLSAALNLFVAVLKLSEGEAWFGALYLAMALLMGVFAGKAIVGVSKGRQAKPPEQIR